MSAEILLSEIEREQRYEVVGFKGGGTEYEAKLHRLGFVEGTEVSLVPAQRHDPMIVRIRGSRIALRTTEAGCVVVKLK